MLTRIAMRGVACLLAASLLLSGCSAPSGVEDRAYAVALGMDLDSAGRLALTVRVPRVGAAAEGGGDSPYLSFSAARDGWPSALAALRLALPRPLNLSHIVLLAVSQSLASSPGFPALIRCLSETRNLYTATRVVVCPDDAGAFIAEEEPVIGARLSSEIEEAMAHCVALGAIPDTCLADLYCTANGIYGDIAVALGQDRPKAPDTAPASAITVPEGKDILESPSTFGYGGSAVFCRGQLRLHLDAEQTLFLNLVNGTLHSFDVDLDGRSVPVRVVGRPSRRADLRRGRLSVCLRLASHEPLSDGERRDVERAVAEGVTAVVHACQREQLDPFRFAEAAARHFLTVRDWQAFDWRDAYSRAGLEVRVALREE